MRDIERELKDQSSFSVTSNRLKDLSRSAFFSVLTALGAYLSIPLFPVPFTMQLPVVLISGYILGPYWGFFSQLVYILSGLIGLPVFSGGRGGMSVIFTPTFGYIIGFLVAAFYTGLLRRVIPSRFRFSSYFILLTGIIPVYLLGALWLFLFMKNAGTPLSIASTLKIGVIPFLPLDIVKCVIAGLVLARFKPKK